MTKRMRGFQLKDMRILFLACLCVVAKVHAANIGEDCTQTSDCPENGNCDTGDTGKCICNTDYIKSADNTMCKAKEGTACTGTGVSNCITNAECTSDTCSCKNGYKAETNKETCIVIYNTICTDNAGCAGLAESECKDDAGTKKCKCKGGYKHVTPACVANQVADPCTADTECPVANSKCTGTAPSKTCTCNNGYKAKADKSACDKVYDMTCAVDADCNTNLKYGKCGTTDPKKCMCDATKAVMESNVCTLKADGDCNVGQVTDDICPMNSQCKSNKCECDPNFEKDDTTSLCKATNGSGMAVASVMLIVTALATVLLR